MLLQRSLIECERSKRSSEKVNCTPKVGHPLQLTRCSFFIAHSGKRPLYVLKNHSGELLAWGSFSDYYPRPAFHISAEISIYVRHNMRGVGVGKILLRNMLERAPSLGIKNVLAVIFGHNHPSLHLFHSFGFQEWGRLPAMCDLETFEADVVILGKRIT